MLLDLDSFIKVDFLHKELSKSCVVVSNFQEADEYAWGVIQGKYNNVIFEKSSLKNYCFNKIQSYMDVNIINCHSCLERFCESLKETQLTIFDNVNKCTNIDILSIITNRKGILVC